MRILGEIVKSPELGTRLKEIYSSGGKVAITVANNEFIGDAHDFMFDEEDVFVDLFSAVTKEGFFIDVGGVYISGEGIPVIIDDIYYNDYPEYGVDFSEVAIYPFRGKYSKYYTTLSIDLIFSVADKIYEVEM